MHPPQPPRGPFPGPSPSGGPFGRGNLPGMGVGGPPLPAPTIAPSRAPGAGYPSTGMPAPSQNVVAEVPRGPTVRFQPQVQFYHRLRTGKLHRLLIRIEPEGGSAGATTVSAGTPTLVTLQPIIPGAMVTPTTSDLPMRMGGEAVFHVLPLVAGKLPEARLELGVGGKRFTNAMLPMRANRGLLGRVLFLLTLLITILFLAVPIDTWEPYRRMDPTNPGVVLEFRGDAAVREGLKDQARRLEFNTDWNGKDYLIALLHRYEPQVSATYQWLSAWQRSPLGGVFLFAFLLCVSFLAWFLQRPARRTTQGAMLEMKV